MSAAPPLTALVLAGGRSTRMGRNKALLPLEPGGAPVVALAVERVRAVADEVLLVGADPEPYRFLGLPHVPDSYPDAGPLGGILAGLRAALHAHALVVACDMPFLSAPLLERMARVPRDYDVLLPMLDEPEPLHAIYARACAPLIDAALAGGRRKITGWFGEARVAWLARPEIEALDPGGRSFYNMNTPEEWESARAILREMRGCENSDSGGQNR